MARRHSACKQCNYGNHYTAKRNARLGGQQKRETVIICSERERARPHRTIKVSIRVVRGSVVVCPARLAGRLRRNTAIMRAVPLGALPLYYLQWIAQTCVLHIYTLWYTLCNVFTLRCPLGPRLLYSSSSKHCGAVAVVCGAKFDVRERSRDGDADAFGRKLNGVAARLWPETCASTYTYTIYLACTYWLWMNVRERPSTST